MINNILVFILFFFLRTVKCECYVIYHSSDFLKTASKCRKRSCGPYQKSRWVAVSWPVHSGWPQPCSVTSRAVPPPLRGRMTPSPRGHGFRCCSQVIQVTGWVRILGLSFTLSPAQVQTHIPRFALQNTLCVNL